MRLSTVLVAAPLTVLGVVFAIANRQSVRLSLNPFDPSAAPGIELPLFAALFLSVLLGMAIAGFAVWSAQAHWRRRARSEHREAVRLRRLAEKAKPGEPPSTATP